MERSKLTRNSLRRAGSGSSTSDASLCCADWDINQVGYFALDPVNGNDGTGGVDVRAAGFDFTSIGGFPIVKRFKTFAGFRAKFPADGNNRTAVLLVAAGTYGEDWDWRGVSGYRNMVRRASDLTNSVADRIQCAFANANGSTVYTVDAAPAVSGWNVVGAPLVADAQVGRRFHFLSGTANGKVGSIIRNTTALVEPNIDISAGIAAGDTFIIERPAAVFVNCYEVDSVSSAPSANGIVTGIYPTCGIAWTTTTGRGVGLGVATAGFGICYVGCESRGLGAGNTNPVISQQAASLQIANNYQDETDTTRTNGAYFTDASPGPNFFGANFLSVAAIFCLGAQSGSQTPAVFGATRQIVCSSSGAFKAGFRTTAGAGSDADAADVNGGGTSDNNVGPASVTSTRPVRVYGPSAVSNNNYGFLIQNRGGLVQNVDVQNAGARPACKISGNGGSGVRLNGITGTTGNTDIGIDLTDCKDKNILLGTNTVTGTAGDIRVSGAQIQTHANYTVSSYRDDGGNFIQGSAKNTSYPHEHFCGLHIGDAGAAIEFMAKYNLLLGAAAKYPSRSRWMRGIEVQPSLNATLANVLVTLYKNGVATAMTVTVLAGSNALVSDFAHPIQFADGDYFDLVVTSTGAVNNVFLSCILEHT